MKIIDNALIKDYTTYKLSGKIKKIIIVDNVEELKKVVKENKNYKVIGNGSNLIISDSYNGVLIKLNFKGLKIMGTTVNVDSGFNLSKLSRICAEKGLSGLEFACGIPGTIGGAIYMNAGAYGHEIFDIIKSVTVLDKNLNVITLNKNLKGTYRNSIIKENNYICISAEIELKEKKSEIILDEINRIMKERREKQPLDYPSAGSVFKNPIGYSSGRLIERTGLKGCKVGGAEVSLKHANFIINKENASAEDVIELIKIIKKEIKEAYDIDLECEQEILKG